jgi:hypothetical protein
VAKEFCKTGISPKVLIGIYFPEPGGDGLSQER